MLSMGRAMIDLCADHSRRSPAPSPSTSTTSFDAVHGGQQLRLFNAHYDEYGFQPIVVFDGAGRFVTAVLRPARRPGGKEFRALLRRLVRAIRSHWPKTEILLRGDGALHAGDDRLLPRQRSRLHLRRGADLAGSSTDTGPRGQSDGDVRGCAEKRRFDASKCSSTARKAGAASERIIAPSKAGAPTDPIHALSSPI